LETLNVSGRRLQPRLDTLVSCDVVLCTLETLTRHCKAQATAAAAVTTNATVPAAVVGKGAGNPNGSNGNGGASEWHTRRPLAPVVSTGSNNGSKHGNGQKKRVRDDAATAGPNTVAVEGKSVLHKVRALRFGLGLG